MEEKLVVILKMEDLILMKIRNFILLVINGRVISLF